MLVVKKVTKKKQNFKTRHAHWQWWHWLSLVALLLVLVYGVLWGGQKLIKAHTFQFYGTIVQRVNTDKKLVALTFDDGPLPGTTRELLSILKRNDAKATFFMLGKNIEAYPDITKSVIASGNEIGNHSYNHRGMAFMSVKEVADEIETTDALLRKNGYSPTGIFRPPYGDKLFSLPQYLSKHDMTNIMWNINPDDHPPASLSPGKILTTVMANIQPGSIIVLHPEYEHRSASLNAVEPIIVTLKKLGYEFVTVSQLLQYQ